jgi:phage gp36-like protein
MGYLTTADIKRLIQTNNLNEVTGSDSAMVTYAEQAAITEVKSYLVQKYDVASEFRSFKICAPGVQMFLNDRMVITAAVYNPLNTYQYFEMCTYQNKVYYMSDSNAPATGAFNPAQWTFIQNDGTMVYLDTLAAYPEFNIYNFYNVGDKITYADYLWTCKSKTLTIDEASALQYAEYANIPVGNQFPTATNQTQWTKGVQYSRQPWQASAAPFVVGDNRNQQLVNYVIDVMLYHLFSRIAPRNIPELRMERYDMAIAWLKNVAKGDDITADLPRLQPKQGNRLRWGSNVKANNTY